MTYQPGDSLGIAVPTNPSVVEELLQATGLADDAPVTVKASSISLASALTSLFEITNASPRFIEQWARLSEAAELEALVKADAAERVRFLEQHHVIDIVRPSLESSPTICSPVFARCSRGSIPSLRARRRSATKRI